MSTLALDKGEVACVKSEQTNSQPSPNHATIDVWAGVQGGTYKTAGESIYNDLLIANYPREAMNSLAAELFDLLADEVDLES